MKEATGEGSMTIVTIIVIIGLAAAAAAIVIIMNNKAKDSATNMSTTRVDVCPQGYTMNAAGTKCVSGG